MAKIARFNGNLRAFGADAVGTERTVFGDELTQSDVLDDNLTADFFRGWGILAPGEKPPKQFFNGMTFSVSQILAYLHQMGIAEWNTNQEYHQGARAIGSDFSLYKLESVSDTGTDPVGDLTGAWVSDDISRYLGSGDFYTDSGAANAYVLTPTTGKVGPSGYSDGMRVRFIANNNNTGIAVTVNVNGLGVKSIVRANGSAPYADLIDGRTEIVFDLGNDRFELVDSDHAMISTAGYQKFSNGIVIQWGISTGVTSGSSVPITFPIAFPNDVFRISVTGRSSTFTSSLSGIVANETATGFDLGSFSSVGLTRSYDWIAIGY